MQTGIGSHNVHRGSLVNGTREVVRPLVRHARGLTTEVMTQLVTLATSALGLVAALAWNDAVQAVFKEYYPAARGITGRFVYAVVISILITLVTINLTKLANLAKNGRASK